MSVILLAHLLLTAAYAGFQWTVQVVVYRQFALVPATAFPAYERGHQRRISYVVGPLFGGQLLTTALLYVAPAPEWGRWWSVGLLAAILAVTAFVAVPLHGRLAAGFDQQAFRALLRADLVRAVLATGNVAVALLILV